MNRYARQMILPEVGAAGQARLAGAHVLVVGAGGLGCPVLQYLAGAGVGEITLLDPDHVEESNLHRQPLYRMADIGAPKVIAAERHLRAANPALRLNPSVSALDPATAPAAVAAADLVIDAADSFAVTYTLSDECLRQAKPLISASALGQTGYAGGFCGPVPSLRAVFPDLPDTAANCATAGVLGPVVGMIGALQAQMALRILLDLDPSPLGRLVTLDLATLRFGGFDFRGAPEPGDGFRFIARSDVIASDAVIELRDMAEAPVPAMPQARRIAPDALSDAQLDPARRAVLCCRTGLRAWRAARLLRDKGHRNLAVLAAGDGA